MNLSGSRKRLGSYKLDQLSEKTNEKQLIRKWI